MVVAHWVMQVAEQPAFKAPTIRVAVFLARHSDETGYIGPNADGQPVDVPQSVADGTGLALSTVFKAYAELNASGFIHWRKAYTPLPDGTGRVRLVLNTAKAA